MTLKIFHWRLLKTKITLFTLAIFLFSIWSLALYISNYLRQDMQHMLCAQQFSIVSLLASEVNDALETRLEILENTSKQISSVTFSDPVTLQTSLEQRPGLQALFNGGTFVTGVDGVAIACVPISIGRIGASYIERDSILATLKDGKTRISKPVVGKKLMAPTFTMTTPMHDADDKVVGVLVGVVDLSKPNFLDRIAQYKYGTTGGYFILAPEYRLIVTASDKTRVMQQYPAPGILPAIDRFLAKDYKGGSSVYVNPLGIEVLGSAKTIPVAGWLLGAILPTAEAFSPIRAMQRQIVLAAILMSVFVGGLTWWVSKRLLSPMITAVKTLLVLSNTDQPLQPLPITSQNEVGELIGGLNRLLGTLAQREGALKESEQRYRHIVETSLEGIWIGDENRRTTYVNKRFAQMLGYAPEEMLGRNASDLVMPEDLPDHFEKLVVFERSEQIYERCLRKKDGCELWTIISARGMFDNLGNFMGSFAMFTDITARKQAEDALRASLLEKGILLKEVHHRVKNNLAAIMGLVETQAQALDNKTARHAMTDLAVRIKSMALVHEQLYQSEDFSRIDFQHYLETLISYLHVSYTHCSEVVVNVAAMGVEMGLNSAIPCGLLISELVTNSYKYAFPEGLPRAGAVRCEITVTVIWDGKAYTLTVADNGVGLPANVDWSTAETMGLLLVRMLGQHQLQGRIELDRRNGTTFKLWFTPKDEGRVKDAAFGTQEQA
ncbi:MAG: PAS domain S-box protein [Pseudomonadota bacterium]